MNEFLAVVPAILLIIFGTIVLRRQERLEISVRHLVQTQPLSRTINPEMLGEPHGWTNGLLMSGSVLFIAGQTARDATGRIVGSTMHQQWRQALTNVLVVVGEAGGSPTDIARMTVFVTDVEAYRRERKEIGAVWKECMGRHYPAMSVVEVSGLVDDGAVIEIEATAVIA